MADEHRSSVEACSSACGASAASSSAGGQIPATAVLQLKQQRAGPTGSAEASLGNHQATARQHGPAGPVFGSGQKPPGIPPVGQGAPQQPALLKPGHTQVNRHSRSRLQPRSSPVQSGGHRQCPTLWEQGIQVSSKDCPILRPIFIQFSSKKSSIQRRTRELDVPEG